MKTLAVNKEDLRSWFGRLESLQKCNREPAKCKHDRNEAGEIQSFDYASIDMCLSQIIGEMQDYLNQR